MRFSSKNVAASTPSAGAEILVKPSGLKRISELLAAGVRREPFLAAMTLLALLYVAASLCPSAYAIVLNGFEVKDNGLIFGWPQLIRSDEYAVWTPTVQAVVANDFGPVNQTSLYQEKFRTLSALPLRDWGLIFKPEFWAFFVMSPARAFSAYHAFHGWLFLVGWIVFLRRLGVGRHEATLATIVLLASAWAQAWWTSLAPILVFAPLFVLPLLLDLPAWGRSLATFYITVVWLLDGIFYPPLYVAMTLATGLAILAFRPDVLRPARIAAWVAGALGGVLLAAFYHWDSIVLTAGSEVHGHRNLGGGSVPWQDFFGTFLPSFPYHGWAVIFGSNPCETAAAGSVLWPLILFFVRPASFKTWLAERDSRLVLLRASGLLLLFGMVAVWMLAPVPANWGKPLLWHLTVPSRLLVLPGLLSLFLALLVLPRLELRWSRLRALLFSLMAVAFWAYSERFPREDLPTLLRLTHKHSDLLLVPLVFVLPLFEWLRRRFSKADSLAAPAGASLKVLSPASLLAAAALANLFYFGLFNPIQSSQAIFAKHDSPELRALRAMQDAHPRGWLVVGGVNYFGSILNGLGFRSVNHALPNPEVEKFSAFFPWVESQELNTVFNRYLNIQVSPYRPPYYSRLLRKPETPRDNAVLVPPEPFLPPMEVKLATGEPALLPRIPGKTKLDVAGPRWWVLDIEGPIAGLTGEVGVEIHTDPPASRIVRSWRLPPLGLPERLELDHYSRLIVDLLPSPGQPIPEQGIGWCITLHDPKAGSRQIAPKPDKGRSTCPAP